MLRSILVGPGDSRGPEFEDPVSNRDTTDIQFLFIGMKSWSHLRYPPVRGMGRVCGWVEGRFEYVKSFKNQGFFRFGIGVCTCTVNYHRP